MEDACVFRQEGEYWTLAYRGRTARLRDTKGLSYIACLLAQPCRDLHGAALPPSITQINRCKRSIRPFSHVNAISRAPLLECSHEMNVHRRYGIE